jgi:hypothetical protein
MKKKSWELSAYGPDEMIKPKELIEIKGAGNLTLQDRRLFNILLNNAWGTSIVEDRKQFTIDTAQLKEPGQTNQRLYRSINTLMKTVIVENANKRRSQMLGSNDISPSGILTYEFPTRLSLILKESNVFAKLDLAVMGQFSSKYAFALYEAISRRINLKHKFNEELDMEGMRTVLSVEDGKLEAYRNLRIKAIEPAVTEVNDISPYNVTITPRNKGRKVIGFKMYWYVKDEQGLKKSYEEIQSAKVGRTQRQEDAADTIIES